MTSLSRVQARAVVDEIFEENGGLTPEERATATPGILRKIENLRHKLGRATQALSKDLYSKDTRFILELIQNAEDNSYENTEKPSLLFAIYPDRIEVRSNEDGFNEKNVRAICSVGESTKTKIHGYIGEKGIGFKSVFKVASKVHIQSGPFSFSFEHQEGDSGLGMVTPINEEHAELPDSVKTQITMYLSEPSNYDRYVQELLNLPDTLLLFFTKLKILEVWIFDGTGFVSSVFYHHDYYESHKLSRISRRESERDDVSSYYYIQRKQMSKLPTDKARPGVREADVVLAFPVDENLGPNLLQQYVFAFLPLRQVGFNFVIQSDFITSANREDIQNSPWNEQLRLGVADAFCDAVQQIFCARPNLQYSWLAYLPDRTVYDPFWSKLRPLILARLSEAPIMRPWDEKCFKPPSEVKSVPENYLDDKGEPFFDDAQEPIYCSPKYKCSSELLVELGTLPLTWELFLDRLEADLRMPASRMKTRPLDSQWHLKLAYTLCDLISTDRKELLQRLEASAIIPTYRHGWLSVTEAKVEDEVEIYLPQVEGTTIPKDLGFLLLKLEAFKGDSQVQLYTSLGLEELDERIVLDKIWQKHRRGNTSLSYLDTIDHLNFVYEYEYIIHHPSHKPQFKDHIFWLRGQDEEFHLSTSLYLMTDGKYDAHNVLRDYQSKVDSDFAVRFLDNGYVDTIAPEAKDKPEFISWLNDMMGIGQAPRLENPERSKLSKEAMFIFEHKKNLVVPLLKTHWPHYKALFESDVDMLLLIRATEVTCQGGELLPLEKTWLPLPELKERAKTFGAADFMPFLELPKDVSVSSAQDWSFISLFSEGISLSLAFDLAILRAIRSHGTKSKTLYKVLGLYEEIARQCRTEFDKAETRKCFDEAPTILVPNLSGQEKGHSWAERELCVWNSPYTPSKKHPLTTISDYANQNLLASLLQDILQIPDLSWEDSLEELLAMKKGREGNLQQVDSIYKHLEEEASAKNVRKEIKHAFEKEGLIYVPSADTSNQWHSPSSCLWVETTMLPKKAAISKHYDGFKNFFTKVLGVEKPDLAMMVQALQKEVLNKSADHSKLKHFMHQINSMSPTMESLKDLAQSKFLPVRQASGYVVLKSPEDDFAIVDRDDYGRMFRPKISTLSFSLEEVRYLRPILEALGVQHKYLSTLVQEASQADGGSIARTMMDDLRARALYFLRCAVHFGSSRVKQDIVPLYKELRTLKVWSCEGIFKELRVQQDGKTHIVKGEKANLHLEEDGSELNIYVPKDEVQQAICLNQELPKKIYEFMELNDVKGESVLTRIVNFRFLSALDEIMTNDGVSSVDESSLEGVAVEIETSLTVSSYSMLSVSAPGVYTSSSQRSPQPPTASTSPYAILLDQVIRAAQAASFPKYGSGRVRALENGTAFDDQYILSSSDSSPFGTRSWDPATHDVRLGAAGELFAFELLSTLRLPGFSWDNWQSTIRYHVREHTRYNLMEPWQGTETADIVYNDTTGKFGKLLSDHGYEGIPSGTPGAQYLIEVKTTTKDYSQQFIMSKHQYGKIQKITRSGSFIYIIMRVYHLGRPNMGVRVYVDPEELRKKEQLNFSIESWSVTPFG